MVHGIGHQPPGALAHDVATRLADAELSKPILKSDAHGTDPATPLWQATVDGHRVHVCEANWADLSDPDNPPELRLAPSILSEYIDTVASAVYVSRLASTFRARKRSRSARTHLVEWALAGVLVTFAVLVTVIRPEPTETDFGILNLILGVGFSGYIIYATSRQLRYRRLRLRHSPSAWRLALVLAWFPVDCALTFLTLLALFLTAELLLAFVALVVAAVIIDYIMWVPTAAVRRLGKSLQGIKPLWRWLNRLGWVVLVLPTHSLVQAIKATGTLVSIILTERGTRFRLAAVASLAGVYIGFLFLTLLSELLILPVVLSVLPDREATVGAHTTLGASDVVVYLLLAGLYLGLLKLSLPTLDLILDVGNYHLASKQERATYHQRIALAVDALRGSGCGEIHVLAHSLGSVLVYDWLRSLPSESAPVSVLHTIGSPLDVFWYIDHDRPARVGDRHGLAGHVSRAWLNYYAYSDPVCVGSGLRRYECAALRVENQRIEWLGPFLLSHGRYWTNPLVLSRIRAEISR